jgi:hypothetical protein
MRFSQLINFLILFYFSILFGLEMGANLLANLLFKVVGSQGLGRWWSGVGAMDFGWRCSCLNYRRY